MAENYNAVCAICGKPYNVCNTCLEQKTFKPWRTITDSIEHYKIYLAIHGYTLTNNKEQAKRELQNCNLSGLENFNTEIKTVIEKIIEEPKKTKTVSKKTKVLIDSETDKEINE